MIDPRTILLDKNARTIDDIEQEDPELFHSVGEHGVLQPTIAHPVANDQVRMHDGHKRTLANIKHVAKWPLMPVIVTDLVDERAHAWLAEMWIYNEQRKGFSAIEKVEILEQMALDGLSCDEIATQLSLPSETVQAGRRVHANEMARQALRRTGQLTFEQADAFAEYADDPEFCDRLNAALDEPETFDHVVSELQQERAARRARDETIEKLRADDVHILEDHELSNAERLTYLYADEDRQRRLSEDVVAHKACTGHAARVRAAADGIEPQVDFWCRDWVTHGHVSVFRSAAGGRPRKGKRTSAQKAEHKRVIMNNRKWLAAIPVRRKKIAEFLAKDGLPARIHQLMAVTIDEGDVAHTPRSKALACELLGFKPKRGMKVKLAAKLKRASAERAVMINLALLLASFEVGYDHQHKKDTWRRPTTNDKVYFHLLTELWGAKLPMNVAERLVVDPDADKEDWPHLQAGSAPAAPAPDTGETDDTEHDGDDVVSTSVDSGDEIDGDEIDGDDLSEESGQDDHAPHDAESGQGAGDDLTELDRPAASIAA